MADEKRQQQAEQQPRQRSGSGQEAGLPDELREAMEGSMPGRPHADVKAGQEGEQQQGEQPPQPKR